MDATEGKVFNPDQRKSVKTPDGVPLDLSLEEREGAGRVKHM